MTKAVWLDLIEHLELKRPEELLRSLVRKANGDDVAHAHVSVVCDETAYTGIPVKIETIGAEEFLALYNTEGGHQNLETLTILPLRGVRTCTLLNFRTHLDTLCRPGPWLVETTHAPSPMQVRRRWLSLVDEMRCGDQAFDLALSEPDAKAPAVQVLVMTLLDHLEPAIATLKQDALGWAAWAALSAVTLRFEDESSLSMAKEGATLVVSIGYRLKSSGALAQIGSALEAAL